MVGKFDWYRTPSLILPTYFPQDRLRAIANNINLLDRTSGSALFADISGFTALTESIQRGFGVRRGSEELSKHLGVVYSALIGEIEKFGGSVISFAGDSMLCWFDRSDTGVRALNAAMRMQAAMKSIAKIRVQKEWITLTLKVPQGIRGDWWWGIIQPERMTSCIRYSDKDTHSSPCNCWARSNPG